MIFMLADFIKEPVTITLPPSIKHISRSVNRFANSNRDNHLRNMFLDTYMVIFVIDCLTLDKKLITIIISLDLCLDNLRGHFLFNDIKSMIAGQENRLIARAAFANLKQAEYNLLHNRKRNDLEGWEFSGYRSLLSG